MGVLGYNKSANDCEHNPSHLQKEFEEVTKLSEKSLKKDDVWCLLDSRWHGQWKKYVTNNGLSWDVQSDYANMHPGPIDNIGLFKDETFKEIKDRMIDSIDYELVPTECWKLLVDKYGIIDNQPAIERKVIEEGGLLNETVVEIYPIPLKLCHYDNMKKVFVQKCSRAMTIDELDTKMRSLFHVPSDHDSRVWNAFLEQDYEEMDKTETIEKYSLQSEQLVVIETKKPAAEWKSKDSSTSTSQIFNGSSSNSKASGSDMGSTATTSNYQLRNSVSPQTYNKKGKTYGLCGLNNLGNTCFMNSALQCMSNVPALSNYFKSDDYQNELNVHNPLGMGGRIATTYANLVKTIWSGETTSYAPRDFKFAVGQFQSRFLGYQQQDSQELLAFLIDGLHEDLNRITKKPYIEAKDIDDRPHDLMAAEAWENHMKRNDSIIVETLHGLYRSIVDCPECPRISVTFDPFCFLTLPLPVKKEKTLECTFVPLNSAEEMVKYKLTVPKSGTIKDLCKALSEYNQKPYNNMKATDVYNNRFHKVFQLSDQVRNIYEKDVIYVFEGLPDATMVPVYMRYLSASGSAHLFGQPLLVPVQAEKTTFMHLYRAILHGTARFLTDETLKSDIADFLAKSDEELLDTKQKNDSAEEQMNEESDGGLFDLFQIKVVNSFGTFEQRCLENNDKNLKLADNLYLAADWSRESFENIFTNRWSELVTLHDSLQPGSTKKIASDVNLLTCMELFTSKEQLGKENTWYCSSCKKHQQAFKKFDLWMLPPVLIIHLKRFSNSRWSRDKLDTFIDFPIRDLDLSDFVVNPANKTLPFNQRRYNLIAVSNHYGGLGGGHYTAFAKNHIDQKWHYFDDSNVSSATEKQVVTKAAYMLVYQRQDVETWFNGNTEKPFPFLNPILSPRSKEPETKGTSFEFQRNPNEDDLNNNNAEDSMDTS